MTLLLRVALQSELCYEFETVLLGSQRDPSASPKMGPERRSIPVDTATAQKISCDFPLKINAVRF